MDEQARAALLNSRVACALIEMEGMKSANKHREMIGESPCYDEGHFLSLIDKYGIGENGAISTLRE